MAAGAPQPGTSRHSQIGTLLWKAAVSRRRSWRRSIAEVLLPFVLVVPLALVRTLGSETTVPAKTNVHRAVQLGDPFETRYAVRLCSDDAIFAVVPADGLGKGFQKFLRARFGSRTQRWPRVVGLKEAQDVEEYVLAKDYGSVQRPLMCGALIFEDPSAFTVRLNGTIVGNRGAVCGGVDTRRTTIGRAIDARTTSSDWYLCSGFLALQKLASEYLAQSPKEAWNLDVDVVPFPTPSNRSRTVLSATRELISLCLVLFFAYVAGSTTAGIVAEREQKLLEAMRLSGLEDTARLAAYTLCTVPLFGLLGLEFAGALSYGVFLRSNPLLVCTFIGLFSTATASMALCASALFDSAKNAFIIMVVSIVTLSRLSIKQAWAFLVPPMALTQGLNCIVDLELADVGLQYSSLSSAGLPPSMGTVMLVLALDTPLWLMLWACLECMVQPSFGAAAKPWYRSNGLEADGAGRQRASVVRRRVVADSTGIIQDSLPVACIVEVTGVRKEYVVEGRRAMRRLVAVRSLDLGMAESEILALLGHNGAGKSTTVGMLTGLLQPTRGSISVCGFDVCKQSVEARRCLGLCPQYEVLFDDLTASEHLSFVADLRGVSLEGAGASIAASSLLQDVGLGQALAASMPAGALPSGKRRALSVALAFVGNPQFIVLDEPTSGMDPFVRRTMWELVRSHRAGRAICLSTHYMDEAEILGDQVCILSRGLVQCYGSPAWLKVRLGSGYLLTLTRSEEPRVDTAQGALELLQRTAGGDLSREIALTSSTPKEAVLRVPFTAARDFPRLLEVLEDRKAELCIASVTVSATTLEELFLRLADGEGIEATAAVAVPVPAQPPSNPQVAGSGEVQRLDSPSTASAKQGLPASLMTDQTASSLEALMSELAHGSSPLKASAVRQGTALLLKRWQSMRRNKRSVLCLCLLPVLFNALGLASIAASFEIDSPPLELLGTAKDLSPERDLSSQLVLPYTIGNPGWRGSTTRQSSNELLHAGVEAALWGPLNYLQTDPALQRSTSPRAWQEDLQIDMSFTGGHISATEGGPDMSKYQDMKQKGAPEFVIRKVMEKDGITSTLAERFLAGGAGAAGSSPLTGRIVLGLRDKVQGTLDTRSKEVKVELNFGRAMLRAADTRSELHREELVGCAAGGPAQAARAEEASQALSQETQKLLRAMEEGGAPAFARRAFLEKAGVPAEDVEVLAQAASPEAVPPERSHQLRRCALWQAFADALLNSTGSSAAPRYGGLFIESISTSAQQARIAVFYNTSVIHSAPLFLSLLQQAAWAQGAAENSGGRTPEVRVTNWPLPLTAFQRSKAFSSQGFSFFTMSLVGAAFLPASIASDIAQELASGAVRQQILAGMPVAVFTVASLIGDVLLVVLPLLSQLCFVSAFKLAVYADYMYLLAVLLLAFAVSSITHVYAFLPELRSPTGALNSILAWNVVTGFILALAVWILSIPFLGTTANTIARGIEVVGRISPAFNLANALLTIPNTALPGFSAVYGMDPLDWQVTGEALAGLALNFGIYFCSALGRGIGRGPRTEPGGVADPEEDANSMPGVGFEACAKEVHDERTLVEEAFQRTSSRQRSGARERGLVIRNLIVSFQEGSGQDSGDSSQQAPRMQGRGARNTPVGCLRRARALQEVRAVGPLSIAVPQGGVLGLLGVSGSGKSSALAAMTAALPEEAHVRGEVLLDGLPVQGRCPRVGEVGYCPQENELSRGLTVYEHIMLFGRLRGLCGRNLDRETRWLLGALDLEAFECSLSQNLSGGNQRKLLSACALVGSPRLLCLDEPSAGLDPVARRSLWQAIHLKLRTASAVIIVTKSIAEAEALCSKVAILGKDGRINTIGTTLELRGRHGGGHELHITLKRPTMPEIFDSVVGRGDSGAMTGFVHSCVSGLGGSITAQEAAADFAMTLVAGSTTYTRYEQFFQALRAAPWVEGLAGIRDGASKEVLAEDSEEIKAELALRSGHILAELKSLFPSIQCIEASSLVRVYQLNDEQQVNLQSSLLNQPPSGRVVWRVADIFRSVEQLKENLKIAEYSIAQVSLEHVFNSFAAQDQEARGRLAR